MPYLFQGKEETPESDKVVVVFLSTRLINWFELLCSLFLHRRREIAIYRLPVNALGDQ